VSLDREPGLSFLKASQTKVVPLLPMGTMINLTHDAFGKRSPKLQTLLGWVDDVDLF